jgi:hypothetical protein
VGLCEQVNVPNRAVSFLIGKAGQTVSTLEKQSNAKVEFAKVRIVSRHISLQQLQTCKQESESRGRFVTRRIAAVIPTLHAWRAQDTNQGSQERLVTIKGHPMAVQLATTLLSNMVNEWATSPTMHR